jgi:hypothetical protein
VQWFSVRFIYVANEIIDADYEDGKVDFENSKQGNVDDPAEEWEHDYDEYLSMQYAHREL